MQIGTQLSFSFPQEMLGCCSRKEWEKGDRQEFLLHQSLKSLTFKHVQVSESCSGLALGNTCQHVLDRDLVLAARWLYEPKS